MKFTLIVALLALALAGCYDKPDYIKAGPADRGPYRVELLFVQDNCKVYRFRDGYDRYFVRCDGASSAGTSWEELHRNGKQTTRVPYGIPTEEKN